VNESADFWQPELNAIAVASRVLGFSVYLHVGFSAEIKMASEYTAQDRPSSKLGQ